MNKEKTLEELKILLEEVREKYKSEFPLAYMRNSEINLPQKVKENFSYKTKKIIESINRELIEIAIQIKNDPLKKEMTNYELEFELIRGKIENFQKIANSFTEITNKEEKEYLEKMYLTFLERLKKITELCN